MLLFVAGWSDRGPVDAGRGRAALEEMAGALPFFPGQAVDEWNAPSGAAVLAWVAHAPEVVGGVRYVRAESDGFALFAGKATCFACHTGWRFTDDKFHDIGTTTTDQGRGREVKEEALNFAFKTPTLRSVALRAPYMHNASIKSLDDVVRHYEKGGINRPSRSPLMFPIQLDEQERLDLVAFLQTLTGAPEERNGRR